MSFMASEIGAPMSSLVVTSDERLDQEGAMVQSHSVHISVKNRP